MRTAADAERLCAAGLDPVQLDTTEPAQVADAARVVERTGLGGLVNNAGIAATGPVEALELDEWRRVLEVNLLGTVAVTRALLPALLRSRGRVVTVGSVAGRLGLPLYGPYTASKFAVEGFCDVLRREVGPHGVRVVSVLPGVIATPIYDKGLAAAQELAERLPPAVEDRYRTLIASARRAGEQAGSAGLPPEAVARTVARALTTARPRARYTVGRDARIAVAATRLLPDRALDAVVRRLTAG